MAAGQRDHNFASNCPSFKRKKVGLFLTIEFTYFVEYTLLVMFLKNCLVIFCDVFSNLSKVYNQLVLIQRVTFLSSNTFMPPSWNLPGLNCVSKPIFY